MFFQAQRQPIVRSFLRWPEELPKMGVISQQMSFIHFLFLNYRFSNKYAFHVHGTAQASSENMIVILRFTRLLA